jgi:hypothetical protein
MKVGKLETIFTKKNYHNKIHQCAKLGHAIMKGFVELAISLFIWLESHNK